MDCECPLYRRPRNGLQISVLLQNKHFPALSVRGTLSGGKRVLPYAGLSAMHGKYEMFLLKEIDEKINEMVEKR